MNRAVSGSCDHQSLAQQLETTYITPLQKERLKRGEETGKEGEIVQESKAQNGSSKTAPAGSD